MRHPEIIDFLRAEGLTVVETNGWRTRGSEVFDPHGSVNHHTAAGDGQAPSLGICINGRSGIPGPLCNVLQSRQVDGNGLDVVYLVAAGRANHAGSGGWKGLSGNSKVWGLEVEHRGTFAEPFPLRRLETSIRVHVAFAKCSKFDASMVCQHREWAPHRKVDFLAGLVDADIFRRVIANRLAAPTPPAPAPQPTPTQPSKETLVICVPSFAAQQSNGRVAFIELRPVDDDEFICVLHNGGVGSGVDLPRVDDHTPSGLPFVRIKPTTGRALGPPVQHGDDVLVGCVGSGTYQVARKA